MSFSQFKQLVKQTASHIAPDVVSRWQIARERRHIQHFEQRMGLAELQHTYLNQHDLCVADGPFTGMKYLTKSICSALVPKLIGSYEAELHPIITQALEVEYEIIVDIGCAEGYYANGFAMRLPSATVYAFDIDAEAQKLCLDMAILNSLRNQVIVSGACDPARLNALLSARSLVICDCEGYEEDLLRPDLVPALAQTDILVELHDHIKPGVTLLLQQRFSGTHQSVLITAVQRNPEDYPRLLLSDAGSRQLAVSEFRPENQQWAFFQANAHSVAV